TSPGGNIQHAFPGDFDRDGILDVAVATISPTNTVAIWKGDGLGGFTPYGSPAPAPSDPMHLAVGDFNRDGKLDVAAALSGTGAVGIYLQGVLPNPLGTAPATVTIGGTPSAIVAGDFDGDLILDLAVANSGSSSVYLLQGVGNGTFVPLGSV